MVESHKFRNFLYRIKFGPMDAGKAPVLDHSKIAKSFLSTTNYLAHFFQKNKKFHFREISGTVQVEGGQGCRDRIGGLNGIFRGNRNSMTRFPKMGDQNYPDIADKIYLPKQWSLLTWEDKKRVFKLRNIKHQDKRNISHTKTAAVNTYHKCSTTDKYEDSDESENCPGIMMSENKKIKVKKG